MKKLRFNDKKCHKIHYGPQSIKCPKLIVQGKEMMEVNIDDYLGDVVTNEPNMKMNVKKRISKGFGIISQIMNMIEKLSLGFFYFKIALLLRNLIFVNAILVNVEVWSPITKKDIEEFQKLDRILLRRIVNCPVSTPSHLIHLELGSCPLQFLIQARRIMFLHYVLTREKSDQVYKFYIYKI